MGTLVPNVPWTLETLLSQGPLRGFLCVSLSRCTSAFSQHIVRMSWLHRLKGQITNEMSPLRNTTRCIVDVEESAQFTWTAAFSLNYQGGCCRTKASFWSAARWLICKSNTPIKHYIRQIYQYQQILFMKLGLLIRLWVCSEKAEFHFIPLLLPTSDHML